METEESGSCTEQTCHKQQASAVESRGCCVHLPGSKRRETSVGQRLSAGAQRDASNQKGMSTALQSASLAWELDQCGHGSRMPDAPARLQEGALGTRGSERSAQLPSSYKHGAQTLNKASQRCSFWRMFSRSVCARIVNPGSGQRCQPHLAAGCKAPVCN